jgi:hypothetical protein
MSKHPLERRIERLEAIVFAQSLVLNALLATAATGHASTTLAEHIPRCIEAAQKMKMKPTKKREIYREELAKHGKLAKVILEETKHIEARASSI